MDHKRGFTLIELLVVVGIMVVVSAIVLADNNKFGGAVLLQNFAYDVALSIREAQVYGISVQGYEQSGAVSFAEGYGLHFSTADPTHYELFADSAKTGIYQSGEDVPPSPYSIGRGYAVSKLCAPEGDDIASCTPVSALDILFVRPEPDALIAAGGIQCEGNPSQCANSARIVLQSPQGQELSVSVEANGQISVDQKTSQ